jgi:hypothetical protein
LTLLKKSGSLIFLIPETSVSGGPEQNKEVFEVWKGKKKHQGAKTKKIEAQNRTRKNWMFQFRILDDLIF